MAISQVRAQINGQWYTLVYNAETRTYQAEIIPDVFSGNQPGGYYNITVEATNDSGVVATTDGNTFQGLRLVVLETVPPTLTLVSPQSEYVTDNTPAITCTAVDNTGGSGIDPSTATATLDGNPVPSDQIVVTSEENDVYTIVYTPYPALSDGTHDVIISIADNDGNTSSVGASYIIDTTPPELSTELSFEEVVTDAYTVVLSGHTSDITANPILVTVSNNGGQSISIPMNENGDFSYALDLVVGENNITVTATDAAGLTMINEYYIIRLITDRTQNDVDRVNELAQKIIVGTITNEEKTEWFAGMRGAYNATDLNRVNTAIEYIDDWMRDAGYSNGFVDQNIAWSVDSIPNKDQLTDYLNNVNNIGSVFPINNPPNLPESIEYFTYIGANSIEKILVLTDQIHSLLKRSPFYSGEVFCGEV